MKELDIAIIGAGIGGLVSALALRQRGFRPVIYERVGALGEVGAGITLWPNATRVLYALGLGDRLDAIGEEPAAHTIRHFATDETIQAMPRKGVMGARYGSPFYQIHRRDLHDMLVEALEKIAPGSIHLNKDLVALENGDRPRATFADGTGVTADLIVGADGIRSQVRKILFNDAPPRFTNTVAWRGLVPMEAVPEPLRSSPAGLYLGPHRHFTSYTIRQGSTLNYVAVAEVDEWTEEGWTIHSSIAEAVERFGDFSPAVRGVIEATPPELCFKWGLFDRDPHEQWSVGSVTILGDAAHPMLPFLGQGAGMVIEDGMVLARAVAESETVPEALRRYEGARRDRTAYTMLQSRARAEYYHRDPGSPEAPSLSTDIEVTLNSYDAMTVAI